MNSATTQPAEQLRCGDQIATPRRGYQHHGVYIGNGQVVHYARKQDAAWLRIVMQVSLAEFENGYGYTVVRSSRRRYQSEKILARAQSRLGECNYSLLRNNCEHFSNWCINGNSVSDQVRRYAMLVPGVVGLAVAMLLAGI